LQQAFWPSAGVGSSFVRDPAERPTRLRTPSARNVLRRAALQANLQQRSSANHPRAPVRQDLSEAPQTLPPGEQGHPRQSLEVAWLLRGHCRIARGRVAGRSTSSCPSWDASRFDRVRRHIAPIREVVAASAHEQERGLVARSDAATVTRASRPSRRTGLRRPVRASASAGSAAHPCSVKDGAWGANKTCSRATRNVFEHTGGSVAARTV
jgi:hypothetical protein